MLAPRTQSNLRFVIRVSGLSASSKKTSNGFSPPIGDIPPYICFCSPLQDPPRPFGLWRSLWDTPRTLPGIPNHNNHGEYSHGDSKGSHSDHKKIARCRYCGKKGHYKKECRAKERDVKLGKLKKDFLSNMLMQSTPKRMKTHL